MEKVRATSGSHLSRWKVPYFDLEPIAHSDTSSLLPGYQTRLLWKLPARQSFEANTVSSCFCWQLVFRFIQILSNTTWICTFTFTHTHICMRDFDEESRKRESGESRFAAIQLKWPACITAKSFRATFHIWLKGIAADFKVQLRLKKFILNFR